MTEPNPKLTLLLYIDYRCSGDTKPLAVGVPAKKKHYVSIDIYIAIDLAYPNGAFYVGQILRSINTITKP